MLLLSEPKAPGGLTFATGNEGTFTEVMDAAWNNGRYAWNANSHWRALEEAYDRRIKAVQEATGQTLDNPLRAVPSADDYREIARRTKASGRALYLPDYMAEKFQSQLARIAEGAPDKLGVLRPHVPVVADAIDLARGSEDKLNDVLSRTSGLTGTLANLAGGVGAAFEDPATYALAPIGLSGSASKSLLWNALRAAASNAGGQAVIEPFIQQWRAEAGLEAGFLPGLKDVAFAGAVGGGLDFAVRGTVRTVKRARGTYQPGVTAPEMERGATIEEAISRLPDDNPIKAAAAGDDAALVVAAQKIEGHLTAAERGALRQLELDTNMKIDAGEDLAAIAQAIRHAEAPDIEPAPVPRDPIPPQRTPRLDDEAPAPARLGETFQADGKPVAFKTLDPKSIEADASTFQFKGGGDAAGVTDRLRAVKRWDDLAAGKAVVFERADGTLVIADGHQRLGLAKRLAAEGQNVKLTAFIMREADGWTPGDVRALAAKKNMQEGTGSAIDAAKIMRERPDLIDETVPVTEGKLRTARHLSRLEPEAFDAVVAGVVPETWGALVGETAADPALHKAMIDELARADIDTADQARLMIAEMQQLPTTVEHQMTLFGETASVRPLMAERAKVLSGALQQLARDAKVFATLDREAGLVEAAGNVLARDANAVRASKAQMLKAIVEELALKKGRVSDMLSEAAVAVSSGAVPIKRAAEAFARRVGAILDAEGLKGLTDDVAPPAPRGLDEPAGPEVKAEVAARMAEGKSVLGKGLAQISKEITGGQAAVDRVAGGGQQKALAFSLSPKAADALPDVRAKLNEAAALLPKAVRIRLYDRLTFADLPERIQAIAPPGVEERTIAGLWDPEQMIIHLSLSTADPLKTLRHEQVHMMRALGLLPDTDYQRLVRHAEKTQARKTYKIDATYGEAIKAQYADKAAAEAVLVEETVAHLVAERLAGKPIGGGLDKLLKPVRDFLRKVRDALGLKGLRTVEDVFRTIERGGDAGGKARGPLAFSLSSLDLSPEARKSRAKAMGFDTSRVWYHGTDSDFSAFRDGAWLTASPDRAGQFASVAQDQATARKMLLGENNSNSAENIKPLYVRVKNPLVFTAEQYAASGGGRNLPSAESLRAGGHDALIVQRNGSRGSDDIFIVDPSNIRSTNAAFDPGLDGRNGLLFSLSQDDAEAALGVRLHDADLRDKVAGAARKLSGNVDMQANWIEGMGLEQGDAEEIVKLYTGFLKDFRKIMDESTAKRLAREEVAKLLETEALHRKRVALLQLEANTRVRAALSTHKNARGEVDPAQAMIGHLEHYGHEGTPIESSVEGKRKAILGQAHARLEEMIWAFRKTGVSGRRMNRAKMENVVRELFDGGTGDAAAKAFAEAWTEVAEGLRQRFNRAGGAIGKLDKWGLPQAHDARALRKRGLAQWKADTLALLDPAKMRHPISGQPMSLQQVSDSLDVVYRRIVTDGLVDAPADAAGGGRGALHKQHAEHRFLVFKNADAWMKYQKAYGSGGSEGIFAAMMNHVNIMARDIAAMEVLGPNPGLTLEAMIAFVRKEGMNAVGGLPALFPTKSPIGLPWNPETYATSKIQRARDMWAHMHGSANVPVNGVLANSLAAVRNITFATALGSATLSSLTDLGRQQIHRRFAGVFKTAHTGRDLRAGANPMAVLGDVVQQFKSLNRREAVRAGLILESATHVLHESARYAGGFNGPMWSQMFADRMLTWALLTPWTQANRHVFGLSIMAEVADNVGKRFADLDAGLQALFGRYGMGAAEWDAIRQFTPSTMGDADAFVRGRQPGADAFPKNPTRSTVREAGKLMAGAEAGDALDPIRYLKATDIQDERLAERYLEMILQETERAVPSGTVANKALWVGQNQPGSFRGELMRSISMLKSYGTIVLMQDWGRVAAEIGRGRKLNGARFMASIVISSTLLGALAMQLKSLSRGEDPRPMDEPEFWGAAMMQGGGMGIYGDYLFGSVNRFGGGFAGSLAGPVTSRASNLWNLTGGNVIQFAQDEPTNLGRESVAFARMNLSMPFYLRLAYERVLLDELQKVADPEAYQAFRRKASKLKSQFKTGYWWAPGETGPRRAPDFGNIAP